MATLKFAGRGNTRTAEDNGAPVFKLVRFGKEWIIQDYETGVLRARRGSLEDARAAAVSIYQSDKQKGDIPTEGDTPESRCLQWLRAADDSLRNADLFATDVSRECSIKVQELRTDLSIVIHSVEEPPGPDRCSGCGGNIAFNPLSSTIYRDWSDDPHQALCFHCAAQIPVFQQRSPGEFPLADPRYWDSGTSPDDILGAYHAANFALMVARRRCEEPAQNWSEESLTLATSPSRPDRDISANELATTARLDAAGYFLEAGDFATARFIILPIGQPSYLEFGVEPRPFAFGKENRERLRDAWQRIAQYYEEQLKTLLEATLNPTAEHETAEYLSDEPQQDATGS